MTNQEFSNTFDTLISSFSREIPFGKESGDIVFDEYEKSVFLTQAQEELITTLYNGKNTAGDSFEKTEEIRRYLSGLVKTAKTSKEDKMGRIGISNNSSFYHLPEDLWFITYESANLEDTKLGCKNGIDISVIPTTQDEYHRIKNNPFRNSNEIRVLRLDIEDNVVELISKYHIKEYIVRYITKPSPIVLINLDDDLSINGVNKKTECILNPALHRLILERAVELALRSKGINIRNQQNQ